MRVKTSHRLIYIIIFFTVLVTEILIALYIRDDFIRPYGGDILVTVLLCAMVRIFFPTKIKLLPLWVFLFSVAVEVSQFFNLVSLIGLGNIEFFRILMGTSFSFLDILCYAAGCVLFFIGEWLCMYLSKKKTL